MKSGVPIVHVVVASAPVCDAVAEDDEGARVLGRPSFNGGCEVPALVSEFSL